MIKNIVFDIGNVIIQWAPKQAVMTAFPEHHDHDALTDLLFNSTTWLELNAGKITLNNALEHYLHTYRLEQQSLDFMMNKLLNSLIPVDPEYQLLMNAVNQGYSTYALTDNVHEFMHHLSQRYQFWQHFKGIIVSAEVGFTKPSEQIYQCLFNTYHIDPSQTVFIDDVEANVKGAQKVGMHAIQYKNLNQCREALKHFDVMI